MDSMAPVGNRSIDYDTDKGRMGVPYSGIRGTPGLFYVDKGTVNLYSTIWETIIHVNLAEENREIESLHAYINHVDKLCISMEIRNWTGCSQFSLVNDSFRHLDSGAGTLTDIIGTKTREPRGRRGILNFVGEVKYCSARR